MWRCKWTGPLSRFLIRQNDEQPSDFSVSAPKIQRQNNGLTRPLASQLQHPSKTEGFHIWSGGLWLAGAGTQPERNRLDPVQVDTSSWMEIYGAEPDRRSIWFILVIVVVSLLFCRVFCQQQLCKKNITSCSSSVFLSALGTSSFSLAMFILQALMLKSDLMFGCSDYIFEYCLSLDCDMNSSHSWSDLCAQLNINDIMHRTMFTETNTAAAIVSFMVVF